MQIQRNARRAAAILFRSRPVLGSLLVTSLLSTSFLSGSLVGQGSPFKLVHKSFLKTGSLPANTKFGGSPQIAAMRDTFLMVGDTYAALSKDNGKSFTEHDPNQLEPNLKIRRGGMRVLKPKRFDMMLWIVAYTPDSITSPNSIRIGVSRSREELREMKFPGQLVSSTLLGSGTSAFATLTDAVTDDKYLYLSLEILSPLRVRSTVARISLQDIYDGKPLSPETHSSGVLGGYSYCFARGCENEMFFASHAQSSKMLIYRWPNIGNLTWESRSIQQWYGGSAQVKDPGGRLWMLGDRHEIRTGVKRDRFVEFLFGSNAGGSYPYPFVRMVRFDTRNLEVDDQNDIESSQYAIAYPAATANAAGQIGLTASIGGPNNYPSSILMILDRANDYRPTGVKQFLPAGGNRSTAFGGWGDRVSVVPHPVVDGTFLATGQLMWAGSAHANCRHYMYWFGRAADMPTTLDVAVQSVPVSVPVTVDATDSNNRRDGASPLTRAYYPGQGLTLSVPFLYSDANGDRYVFDHWTITGQLPIKTSERVLEIGDLRTNRVAVAHYERAWKLTIESKNATTAPFTLNTEDLLGKRDGQTSAVRYYRDGEPLIIEFAENAGGRRAYSLIAGSRFVLGSRNRWTFTMNQDTTALETYGYFTVSKATTFGTGCTGTNGEPEQSVNGSLNIGSTIRHRLTNATANGFALLVVGVSSQTWSGIPLPFQFPGTNCWVSVSPDFRIGTGTDIQGAATVGVTIPNDTNLLGVTYYSQFAVRDPLAAGDLTTSDAASVKIGGWDIR